MRIKTMRLTRVATGGLVMLAALTFTVSVAGQGTAPTPEQKASTTQLLEHVRTAIAGFADLQVAKAEGYQQTMPYRYGGWGPAHFNNQTYFVGEAVEMMHVWTFNNPDGPFSHSMSPQAIQAAAQHTTRSR